jgi:hypothetical protein
MWVERLSPSRTFFPGSLLTSGRKILTNQSVKVKVSNHPVLVGKKIQVISKNCEFLFTSVADP